MIEGVVNALQFFSLFIVFLRLFKNKLQSYKLLTTQLAKDIINKKYKTK